MKFRYDRQNDVVELNYRLKYITIIDHNEGWSKVDRVARERFWIRKLRTVSPEGINEKT